MLAMMSVVVAHACVDVNANADEQRRRTVYVSSLNICVQKNNCDDLFIYIYIYTQNTKQNSRSRSALALDTWTTTAPTTTTTSSSTTLRQVEGDGFAVYDDRAELGVAGWLTNELVALLDAARCDILVVFFFSLLFFLIVVCRFGLVWFVSWFVFCIVLYCIVIIIILVVGVGSQLAVRNTPSCCIDGRNSKRASSCLRRRR